MGRRKYVIRTGYAFSAGHSDIWTYDDRNEPTDSNRFTDTTPPLNSSPDTTKDRAYTYDPIGNRTDYTEATASPLYYCTNELNQYTTTVDAATCPPSPGQETEAFRYDLDGNLTQSGPIGTICSSGTVTCHLSLEMPPPVIESKPARFVVVSIPHFLWFSQVLLRAYYS